MTDNPTQLKNKPRKTLTRAQAILHPVRARIIVALSERALTPQSVARQMPEIPLGTVYRHINILLDTGMIRVVAERKVHGVTERQFSLIETQSYVNREELTADQIIGLVGALTSIVQATFGRYVRDHPMPPEEGAISLLVKSLLLTREESMALRKTMQEYVQKTGRKPSPEYERRFIAFFAAPDTDISEPDIDEIEIPSPEGNQQ
ncbi:MAG: helix-turn-helix domain-containing protein [bacterium]